jgi:hypothetical protein
MLLAHQRWSGGGWQETVWKKRFGKGVEGCWCIEILHEQYMCARLWVLRVRVPLSVLLREFAGWLNLSRQARAAW